MPFIPFAAAAGSALGTSAAVGGAVIAGGTALAANSVISGQQQAKAAKKASADAAAQNAAAIQNMKDAQAKASTVASDSVKRRLATMSQTVYTSPLGVTEQAATAKKTLLGA